MKSCLDQRRYDDGRRPVGIFVQLFSNFTFMVVAKLPDAVSSCGDRNLFLFALAIPILERLSDVVP